MAVDTSRERLERLYLIAGERRLWGRTWAGFVVRQPHRVIVGSRGGGQGVFKGLAMIAAVGLFGIYPAIGALQQLGSSFVWSDPSTCDGLRYRYEVARDAVGKPKAAAARDDFANARKTCERFATSLPPATPQSVSCTAALRTYARAFDRAERRLAAVPVAEAQTDFASTSRILRSRVNELLDSDDLRFDEQLAAGYLDACNG